MTFYGEGGRNILPRIVAIHRLSGVCTKALVIMMRTPTFACKRNKGDRRSGPDIPGHIAVDHFCQPLLAEGQYCNLTLAHLTLAFPSPLVEGRKYIQYITPIDGLSEMLSLAPGAAAATAAAPDSRCTVTSIFSCAAAL